MKTSIKFFTLATLSLSVVILAAGLVLAGPKQRVRVVRVSGKAEFLRPGKTAWQGIKKGALLYSGDSVKTYRDSRVKVAFDKRKSNTVSIGPNTRVVLKLKDAEKIELFDGEVFSLVERIPRGSRFEIRTPTAVCGARGTGWGTAADKNKTTVNAYEDEVYVKGIKADGSVMEDETIIPEGHAIVVRRFERPLKLFKITESSYKGWDTWRMSLTGRPTREKAKMERLAKDLDKIDTKKERIEDRIEEQRQSEKTETRGGGGGTDGGNEREE